MPAKLNPVRYGQLARWADTYHGWRDGRGGIPQEPLAPGPVTTPHREALIRLAQDAFAREHLEYRTLVAEPHRQIMAERARLQAAEAALATVQAELGRVAEALDEPEATRRRVGEARHPDSVIVRRRQKEHRELRMRAQQPVTRAQGEIAGIEAELAGAFEKARQHHQAAAVRVERIHQYIHRRLSSHRRTLIRFHPDGAWANSAMSMFAPEIPGWALPDAFTPQNVPPPPQPAPDKPGPDPSPPPPAETIELRAEVTRFGSPEEAGKSGRDDEFVPVNSALAAACHFTIRKLPEFLELRTRRHARGPYIGGEQVGVAVLKDGDYFDFGDSRYTVLDRDNLLREPLGLCSIVADRLSAMSGSTPRLTGMSFVQREGTMLAVLGPSGAGKSSLCFAMLGELPLQSGRLFFGQIPLDKHTRQIRDQLGFVPQDTVLHPSLTVEATLRYGYSLRSSGRKKGKRQARIEQALKDTSLGERRNRRLCTLSGGQLRRVSIALELLSDPPLLMLDEPTSGLDSSMDRQIMDILRTYALGGHTVIVVTHNTDHLWKAHQIVVVADGGTPVFSGTPRRIRKHFNFSNYADLMSLLLDPRRRQQFIEQYRSGESAREARREADRIRQETGTKPAGASAQPRKAAGSLRDSFRQFRVLAERQVTLLLTRALKDNDRSAWKLVKNGFVVALPLIIAAASALLAAFVAGPPGLEMKPSPAGQTALALLTTLSVLSGQALTYNDVVNEIEIIRREHRAGVGVLPVLTAKWLVYALMAIAQAGVITVVFCAIGHRAPQRSVLIGPRTDLFIGLAALSVASMTLGMLISTLSSKLEHAVALVTATSIAQIALNGVTSSLAQFSVLPAIAAALPDRWGLAAVASSVDLRGADHASRALVINDALWTHSTGHWLTDMAWLILLGTAFFALSVARLRARLQPATAGKSLLRRWNLARR
jgi:ABC-type multidrug transport system ATPase subunit